MPLAESRMNIGQRLRGLREAKRLSQGDIQERTGLMRYYVSRVECGHAVPRLETLEKLVKLRALWKQQALSLGLGTAPTHRFLYGTKPARCQATRRCGPRRNARCRAMRNSDPSRETKRTARIWDPALFDENRPMLCACRRLEPQGSNPRITSRRWSPDCTSPPSESHRK